jgi:hypothetical protein
MLILSEDEAMCVVVGFVDKLTSDYTQQRRRHLC